MSDQLTIRTNHQPRDIVDPWELTNAERDEFDYLDWERLQDGTGSTSFIRYRGVTYDLGEFMTTSGLPEFNQLTRWDGYYSDSFFSGIVVRYVNDYEQVVVGSFCS